MLESKEVNFAYRKGQPVLNDINIKIADGEFIALLGHNGSGKTTLSRLFMALIHPRSGTVSVDSDDIAKLDADSIKVAVDNTNSSLNADAKNIGKTIAEAKYYAEIDYEVETSTNKILSMMQEFSNYTGGAHDNSKVSTTNINLKNGTYFQLIDVFTPGSDYKERLEWVIDKEKKSQNKLLSVLGKATIEYKELAITGQEKFCLVASKDEAGIKIYYNPGEIAPMSAGVIEFFIPIDLILDIM